MITKIYELTRMSSAFFQSKYCGIVVEFPFVEGRGNTGNNKSAFITSDRFVQDAIENDPRFNKVFYLAEVIKDEEELKKEEAAQIAKEMASADAEKPKKGKKKKEEGISVDSVVTINDAFDYFASKGIAIEDIDSLHQTMRELNVSFPNLDE